MNMQFFCVANRGKPLFSVQFSLSFRAIYQGLSYAADIYIFQKRSTVFEQGDETIYYAGHF